MRSGSKISGRVGCSQASDWRTPRTIPAGSRATSCDQAPAVSTSRSASTRSSIGADANAVLRLRPFEDALARSQHSATGERALDMGDDAAFGDDEAAVGLVRDLHLGRECVGREAPRHLGAAQDFVLEVVLGTRAENAVEDAVAALDDSRDAQELLACFRLELAPQLVRAAEERARSRGARSRRAG